MRKIATPIQIVIIAPFDVIEPGSLLNISETNRFHNIHVAAKAPPEPTLVRLAPSGDVEAREFELGVLRPTLELDVGSESILGFGLETTEVTVRAFGIDSYPATPVSLTAGIGRLEQTSVGLDANGFARTALRSRNVGTDTISASLAPFGDGEVKVTYERPTTWLAVVLLGAVTGTEPV